VHLYEVFFKKVKSILLLKSVKIFIIFENSNIIWNDGEC
jgi:hypothetical protein